ncbi:hypothetical protein AAVH_13193 [Aphelenchoides avenae]|nr:hypothetical protein AAVH_13193 [Aphelenchus avenae]
MRLWLARIFLVGRRHGNAPSTRRQSAACPNPFEANRRLSSSFYAAWITTAAQQKLPWPSAISLQQLRQFGSLTILHPVCKPPLASIRELHQRGRGPRKWKLTVKMTEENWKILVESGARSRYEKTFRVEIDDRLMSTDDKRLIVIGPQKAAIEVVALLQRPPNEVKLEDRTYTRKPERETVIVPMETWQLFKEYDVPGTLEMVHGVHIQASESSSKQVQLTLRGPSAAKVAKMFADPPRKLEVHERVGFWLIAEGPNGLRVKDIRVRLVKPSRDNKSVLLVGTAEATSSAKSIIDECDCIEEFDIDSFIGFYLVNNDAFHVKRLGVETDALISPVPAGDATKWKAEVVGPTESVKLLKRKLDELHVKRRQISQAAACWLTNPAKSDTSARSLKLDQKFGTRIGVGSFIDSNPAGVVDLIVVGEREENVDDVFAIIGGLHVKHGQIPQAVHSWLINTRKGAECARATDLDRKFDTNISMGESNDDDSASFVHLAVVGEREQNVDEVFAAISSIVVEKVDITDLQGEFWMGHEDEQSRNRPHHRLEDTTDTFVGRDFGAACVHVAGRPEDVKHVVERITKHIELRTTEISLAAGNYIARIRHKFENDDHLQIHLRYDGMRPGTCRLRRLHRVDGEEDGAKVDEADQKLMQEIDLHEVVLDVHVSFGRALRERCGQIEADEIVGMGVSNDAVKGRVLINIAGSRSTVKHGREAVIKLLASDARYKEGDIRLRRIEGQSVDTAGFQEARPVRKEDAYGCKEPFDWERLTSEQWRYTGRSSSERKRKRSTNPKQSKASKNADTKTE